MNIPTDPSQRSWRGRSCGLRHTRQETSHFNKKLQVMTERNLTEIQPSRKGTAARKAPFEVFGAKPPHENVTVLRRGNCAVTKTNFERTCYGDNLNSSGSG